MIFFQFFAIVVALLTAAPLRADLEKVREERRPEKRSEKALNNAESALKRADSAYRAGDYKHTMTMLTELRDSVELSYNSLKETGRDPSRSPKHFKRAEIKLRGILRRLDDFRGRMGYEDRGKTDEIQTRLREIHEELLLGIMGKKF